MEKEGNKLIAADHAPEFEDCGDAGGFLIHEELESVNDWHPKS